MSLKPRRGLRGRLIAGAAIALFAMAGAAQAAPCNATFGAAFSGSYTCNSLGTPTGVGANLGGVTFLAGDNNTLLIGGFANGAAGYIAQIGVTRDAGNHIIGFSGPSTTFATAPNIDGGLQYGPGGVLFATGYPNNTLLQYLPGDTTPSKTITLPGSLSSVGALAFVPTGFSGAGQMKLVSYNNGNWATGTLTPDGLGTYDISVGAPNRTLGGGPEGIAYVLGANAGFGLNSVLVSEYGANSVGAYEVDANGDPIINSRRTFLSGLNGAEGALIDPLTGDFIFSTFGSANSLYVVSGFAAPPSGAVPEPATWAMMLLGFGGLGAVLRSRRKVAVAAA